ncbi:hypothetical protein TWF696_008310 [Orbilia brochopaga]|uniref:Uncharacterized protein n=1 Tax=Orbilia brochopaga TaxID=3140254 RepID=A0AAV9UIR2_9PEZI
MDRQNGLSRQRRQAARGRSSHLLSPVLAILIDTIAHGDNAHPTPAKSLKLDFSYHATTSAYAHPTSLPPLLPLSSTLRL